MGGKEERVVAAVIRRDRKYLICQRPLLKRHGGLWEFPGGKTEATESDAAAISRELWEELEVRAVGVGAPELSLRDPKSPFQIVFLPVQIEGEPSPREHLELRWASIPELLELPLAPSDRVFVRHLAKGS